MRWYMGNDQTLISTCKPNLTALFSDCRLEPWMPMVVVAMSFSKSEGYLKESDTSNLLLSLALVVQFFSLL